jgi:predicted RNase H-like HicB family nuclease
MSGLEAYALDAAVTRWGMAFDAAIKNAGADAKTRAEAERKVQTVIRKWIPSTREYR